MGSRKFTAIFTLVAVFLGVYSLQSKNSRTASSVEVDSASKIIQVTARNVYREDSAGRERSPAAANMRVVRIPRPSDYRMKILSSSPDFAKKPSSPKEEFFSLRMQERKLADRYFKQSGKQILFDRVGLLSGLKAMPREKLAEESELSKEALLLESSWAIFPDRALPQGSPVVYDFENERWGILTGMIEVKVSNPSLFDEMYSGIQSAGLQAMRLGSAKDVIFVSVDEKKEKLESVASLLKSEFGEANVRPEALFVWRSPE